jgi:hypothetical protein
MEMLLLVPSLAFFAGYVALVALVLHWLGRHAGDSR